MRNFKWEHEMDRQMFQDKGRFRTEEIRFRNAEASPRYSPEPVVIDTDARIKHFLRSPRI